MMDRRLIVMRHAKSSWADETLTDHQRPLNARGRASAPLVARRLHELQWVPQCVVSSDAQRTRETWENMSASLEPQVVSVEFTRMLYLAGIDEIREQLAFVPDDIHCVMVLGHNSGWESAVAELTGKRVVLATADAALLAGSGKSWSEALRGRHHWQLVDLIRSRELL